MTIFILLLIKILVPFVFLFLFYRLGRKNYLNIVILFSILMIYCFINLFSYHRHNVVLVGKTCFNNIRVLNGAAEMFNMDNSNTMTELDINELINKKYIKKNYLTMEDKYCNYQSKGDLTKDGEIYCVLHGSLSHQNTYEEMQEIIAKLEGESATKVSYSINQLSSSIIDFIENKFGTFCANILGIKFSSLSKGAKGIGFLLVVFGIWGWVYEIRKKYQSIDTEVDNAISNTALDENSDIIKKEQNDIDTSDK